MFCIILRSFIFLPCQNLKNLTLVFTTSIFGLQMTIFARDKYLWSVCEHEGPTSRSLRRPIPRLPWRAAARPLSQLWPGPRDDRAPTSAWAKLPLATHSFYSKILFIVYFVVEVLFSWYYFTTLRAIPQSERSLLFCVTISLLYHFVSAVYVSQSYTLFMLMFFIIVIYFLLAVNKNIDQNKTKYLKPIFLRLLSSSKSQGFWHHLLVAIC